jgi:hypothetical protein
MWPSVGLPCPSSRVLLSELALRGVLEVQRRDSHEEEHPVDVVAEIGVDRIKIPDG